MCHCSIREDRREKGHTLVLDEYSFVDFDSSSTWPSRCQCLALFVLHKEVGGTLE